jgi:6-phosphogluconate dehydrogenase
MTQNDLAIIGLGAMGWNLARNAALHPGSVVAHAQGVQQRHDASEEPTYGIQPQHGAFGSHGYERNDRRGRFHTEWRLS